MRVVEFSGIWTIFVDFAVWFAIHLGCTLLTLRLPDRFFTHDTSLFRTRNWERNGLFWQKVFRVRSWKDRLPDGGAVFKKGFRKKTLHARDHVYYNQFIVESRRGELTHWLVMLPAPLFFFWNPAWAGWVMIVYALLANGPCIIAQRYNRPRFQCLIDRSKAARFRPVQASHAAKRK